MKTSPLPLFVAFLLPAVAWAAKGEKRPQKSANRADGAAAEVLKTFDKNGDHQIDADELPALQKAFSTLKNLDKNNNGQIELSEVEKPKAPAEGDRRSRMIAGFSKVDKNGNHKIDADEVEGLQKMIAGGRIMSRLDQNGNGKLDPNEVEVLNSRIGQGIRGKRPGASSTPSFRRPPEQKPAESPKPEEAKAEKPAAPAPEPKPPGDFGS